MDLRKEEARKIENEMGLASLGSRYTAKGYMEVWTSPALTIIKIEKERFFRFYTGEVNGGAGEFEKKAWSKKKKAFVKSAAKTKVKAAA